MHTPIRIYCIEKDKFAIVRDGETCTECGKKIRIQEIINGKKAKKVN